MQKSSMFTSTREKSLWILAGVVLAAILTTLVFGGQLLELTENKRWIEQSTFNLFLVLVISLLLSGWKSKKQRIEFWIYGGAAAVIGMALLRMDLTVAERSHMFEYGLLSILIYEALKERVRNGNPIKLPAVSAFAIVGLIGLIDELVQLFIPYRVFDWVDIGFNFFASAFGILLSLGVSWLQQFISHLRSK